MASIAFQPARVASSSDDENGVLAWTDDGRLIAVLVQLEDEAHQDTCRHWHLKAGFGLCHTLQLPVPFLTLDDARDWLLDRLNSERPPSS